MPTPTCAILNAASVRKPWVSTGSPSSNQPVSFEAFAADIARRREAAGNPELPRNEGARRTPAKRALLDAIEKAGGRW
jgi:hypothetical protein